MCQPPLPNNCTPIPITEVFHQGLKYGVEPSPQTVFVVAEIYSQCDR